MLVKKTIELRPIKESSEDFDQIEKRLKEFFRAHIYYPILLELGLAKKTIANETESALREALRMGLVTFNRGVFSGRFSASISRELKDLGARWDRRQGTWNLPLSKIPREIRESISTSEHRFKTKLEKIDKKLAEILPEAITSRFKCADLFDRTLYRTDQDFKASVKGIAVPAQLTSDQRNKIADEWQENMHLWIKDFTKKEIKELRKTIKESVFKGNRYGSLVETIQKSYGVSANKAKFLARQETGLLMAKFKEVRYKDSGIKEYLWGCVAGSKNHPVRPRHQALADASKEGKVFRWDNPPVTSEPGQSQRRNNPGQDYNCRCFAKPIVTFRQ